MPKVSVIIPVYNVEKYLRECLDSVVNQTLSDIEIICVNDCSPDNSLDILKEYASKDKRIKIIDLKVNGGLGNARNVALPHVTSDYVMFLDSDDWYELNACEEAYNQIIKNNNDFVIFNFYKYKDDINHKYLDNNRLKIFSEIFGIESANPSMLTTPYFLGAPCWYKIFNFKFLKDNNILFDTCKFEDQLFNVKIYYFAKSISVIEKPLCVHRIIKSSISRSLNSWDDFIKTRHRAYNYIKSLDINNTNRINLYVASAIKATFVFYRRLGVTYKQKSEFYRDVHKLFKLFYSECNIDKIRHLININEFYLFTNNSSYEAYLIKKYIIDNIFSTKNTQNKKHKIITILGIKVKVRRKQDAKS